MNGTEKKKIWGQTIDKTMVKPGGVVRNYEVEMGHCPSVLHIFSLIRDVTMVTSYNE